MRRTETSNLFADAIEREYIRVYKTLQNLPALLLTNKAITVKDLEEIGLTGVDIYIGKWEQVIENLNSLTKLRTEHDVLTKQFDNLRESIYNAVETSLRPVRDMRIGDQ